MQGTLLSLDRGQVRGRVRNTEGETNEYTIYFGSPSNMNGLRDGDTLEYQIVQSKTGNYYAKYVRKIAGAAGNSTATTVNTVTNTNSHTTTSVNSTVSENDERFGMYKSVTDVNDMIGRAFSHTPEFQTIFVKGEVTNYSGPSGGNYYFALKDSDSKIDCIMWGSDATTGLQFNLEAGQQVAIIGKFDFYGKQGTCRLHAKQILEIGDGAEAAALEELRKKLEAEGIFDEAHKKPIPKHPTKVGIVTSRSGQAIRDIVATTKLRKSNVQLYLYHVTVQGQNAISSVLEGIEAMDALGLDTIIVGRGGGSDEELKFYNDERIVRLVYNAVTPIISAVGHEGHVPLIDLVADMRASTPTQAAEIAIPDMSVDIRRMETAVSSMHRNMKVQLQTKKMLLENQLTKLEKNNPERKLKEQKEKLKVLTERMDINIHKVVELRNNRYKLLVANLHGLSPTAKLINGFGYITGNEQTLTSVKNVKVGDPMHIVVHDGEVDATITGIKEVKID